MRLHERLNKEREKGLELQSFFNAKGWYRSVFNNTFHKRNITACFHHPYIIFHFNNCSVKPAIMNTYHRIKYI